MPLPNKKINRDNLSDIWKMRNLTVGGFLSEISKHPELKFLITAVGAAWIMSAVIAFTIGANVIYYVCRIFRLVLG